MGQSRWNPEFDDIGLDIFPLGGDAPDGQPGSAERTSDLPLPPAAGDPLGLAGADSEEDLLQQIFHMIHKINNHLQVVTINAEMMEMMAGGSNRYVEKILDASILIREMMDEFRDEHAEAHQRIADLRKQLSMEIGQG